MNDSVSRVELAHQLYNIFHIKVGNEEDKDTRNEIGKLNDMILKHHEMKLFYREDTQRTSKKGACTDNSENPSGKSGDKADCTDLRAQGYEVKEQEVIFNDAYHTELGPGYKVWQPPTYHASC